MAVTQADVSTQPNSIPSRIRSVLFHRHGRAMSLGLTRGLTRPSTHLLTIPATNADGRPTPVIGMEGQMSLAGVCFAYLPINPSNALTHESNRQRFCRLVQKEAICHRAKSGRLLCRTLQFLSRVSPRFPAKSPVHSWQAYGPDQSGRAAKSGLILNENNDWAAAQPNRGCVHMNRQQNRAARYPPRSTRVSGSDQ